LSVEEQSRILGGHKAIPFPHGAHRKLLFVRRSFSLQNHFFGTGSDSNDQKGDETTSMDCRAGPHLKDDGASEEARIAHRQNAEANGRRKAAKGI
jgi:hypothetical protein